VRWAQAHAGSRLEARGVLGKRGVGVGFHVGAQHRVAVRPQLRRPPGTRLVRERIALAVASQR
jgi:hypothetical protein